MTATMQAIVVQTKGTAAIKTIPVPKLRPNYVKIKVIAVALNPTDWKHIESMAGPGVIVGCDVTGKVLEVGDQVRASIVPGDHIYGFINGANDSNKEDGAFAEYAVIKDGMFAKVPHNLSDEAASSFGVGVITCGQALGESLKLPLPSNRVVQSKNERSPILIYGGSTATGVLAIQFAKQSNLEVIVTAGKHNFELVKSFGADAVFDYHDEDCGHKIREYTKNRLFHVFDTIANKSSSELCATALSSEAPSEGLHYSSLQPVVPFPRSDVHSRATLAYTAIGEEFVKTGTTFPASEESYEFASKWMALAAELISQGIVRPTNIILKDGGLDQILNGLQELREGKVRGEKLVYKL